MMKKLLALSFGIFLNLLPLSAQETINLSGYDGSGFTVIATSTVNDVITIVFEDVDILQNFYTEFQDEIYMYGGLDTVDGPFQGVPDFNDFLVSHPVLSLIDGDNATGPNTYSITINLASEYNAVPDGTMVFGYNLLFQNQFGGLGQPNNQTENLYIDLTDAMKDSTLSLNEVSQSERTIKYFNNRLFISSHEANTAEVEIYNVLGKRIYYNNNLSLTNSISEKLDIDFSGVVLIAVTVDGYRKVIKAVKNKL